MSKKALIILYVFTAFSITPATTFYVDPQNGDISNTGTSDSPWSTLQEVFDSNKIETRMYETKPAEPSIPLIPKNQGAPVKAGDTLMLRSGYHGDIYAVEYYNQEYITIMAQPGHTPTAAHCELRSGCRWKVYGLTISPEFGPVYIKKTLLQFSSHSWTGPSWDCIAEACTAYSVLDASNWTAQQWDTVTCNGASVPGTGTVIRNCYFKNVNFGISVTGDSCLIEFNTVENFSGDGLRGLGNYETFQYNTIKNCYAVNANHDDGFQSWSLGADGSVGTGVVYGIVLRGNTIINYEDPNQLFRGTLQAIGCFDGMFEEWLVENNVIITDHWHGITLLGATNCIIVNNTVVDINTESPGPPWISIGDHKDGTPSTGCVVRNNLATDYNHDGDNVTEDHNIQIDNYDDFFVDYASFDLHLKQGCAAIDSGGTDLAPSIDRDRNPRPQGSGIDIGAYEYGDAGIIRKVPRSHRGAISINHITKTYSIIHISLSNLDHSSVKNVYIHDSRGRVISALQAKEGSTILWPTKGVVNGVYFVRFKTADRCFTHKVFLMR